ncbi:cell division protein FtsQ/DivIB [Parabacteroides sp. PF5-6]|uniref:cell division protein FtsQ/DivIB n=1 Tax=Parabacteroides sp. PF5-6 TaxID=1742403 RepID=UPI00240633A7|nr:cell division protein FtsQ/DivIB [Parabacteroides sp. PF5-6]MDF9829250.1 cell division protein FtsQ [Parabacteroides sp. PF5-6]
MVRFLSLIIGLLLLGYIFLASFYFTDKPSDKECDEILIVVKDSLNKHFVNEQDVLTVLKKVDLDPLNKPMNQINTESIEKELMNNQMIANVEAYKTPSGKIKLEIEQKIPVLRVIGAGGSYYVDNRGSTMPVSARYVAHVPVASGNVEKELAVTDLYKFALFLQKNDFWNHQIGQIYVDSRNEVELIPMVGNHRIVLGTLDAFEEKLENLQLFYEQVIPKMGWERYKIINLKYKDQIVCTKK